MRLLSIGQTYIRPLRFGCSGGESKASHGRSLSTPRGEHLSPRGRATEALQLAGMSFYRNFGRRNRTRSRNLKTLFFIKDPSVGFPSSPVLLTCTPYLQFLFWPLWLTCYFAIKPNHYRHKYRYLDRRNS